MERCDRLAAMSEEPDRLTRRYGTTALRQAQELVASWMREAGMTVRWDAVGNLIGRLAGPAPDAPALLIGSHLDSVRDAGKYDGPLGVVVALACAERIAARGERLATALEVVAFADEEGLRYATSFLGSSAFAGTFDLDWLAREDDEGITLAAAMRAFGGDPEAIESARRQTGDAIGYAEVHIEQGPTLEGLDLPVGVVTGIVGLGRCAVTFSGEAGHAGTLAMERRRDALCAAAEFVLAVETLARGTPGLVATVGQIGVQPGASNVVPGEVRLSLDIRHADDRVRLESVRTQRASASAIGTSRQIDVQWKVVHDHPAVPCDPALMATMARAVRETGVGVHSLPSGAGHDPSALAAIMPTAMLFVRCGGGISHNPAESVRGEDVAVAIEVMDRFVGFVTEGRFP